MDFAYHRGLIHVYVYNRYEAFAHFHTIQILCVHVHNICVMCYVCYLEEGAEREPVKDRRQ